MGLRSRPDHGNPYLSLLHPAPIVVVLAAASAFCATAVRGRPPLRRLLPFLEALACTQLSISLHNDYCDRELDARAKPWRALPRGLVSPNQCLAGAAALFCAGLLAAAKLGPAVLVLIALQTSAGLAYNAWFKRSIWTWVPYAIALPTLPIVAFVAMGRFRPRLLLAYPLGAPLVLSVYLADTMSDVEIDRAHRVRGLAQALGAGRAPVVCWFSALLGVGLAATTTPRRAKRPGFVVALACLALAPLLPRHHGRDPHWLAIMIAVVATATVWFLGLTPGYPFQGASPPPVTDLYSVR